MIHNVPRGIFDEGCEGVENVGVSLFDTPKELILDLSAAYSMRWTRRGLTLALTICLRSDCGSTQPFTSLYSLASFASANASRSFLALTGSANICPETVSSPSWGIQPNQ